MAIADGTNCNKEPGRTPAAPSSSTRKLKKDKKWTWKKPKGKPKRPLSAYNLFFQEERKRFHSSGSYKKDEFVSLVKTIAAKWMTLGKNERAPFDEMAAVEKDRYRREVAVWHTEEDAKQKVKDLREGLAEQRRGGGAPPDIPKMDATSFATAPLTSRVHRQVTPDACTLPHFEYGRFVAPKSFSGKSSLVTIGESTEGAFSRRSSLGSVDSNTALPPPMPSEFASHWSSSSHQSSTPSFPRPSHSSLYPPPSMSSSSSLLTSDDESSENLGSFLDDFNKAMLKKCSTTASAPPLQIINQTEPGRPRKVVLSSTGANMLTTTQAELDDDCKELMLEIFGEAR